MGAPDHLQGGNGGILDRARSNPHLVVAIAAGFVLLLAWIAWAIHVTSSNGAAAGLGVLIAWPAMLAALALISLPFIGLYLLIRHLATDSGPQETEAAATDPDKDSEDSAEEEEQDQAEEEREGDEADEEDGSDEESDDDSESDAEATAAKS